MLIIERRWCSALLLSMASFLSGWMEVEESIRVHDDGSLSVKHTIKIDPQVEASVFPKFKEYVKQTLIPGARVDLSQRVDGKAAAIIEADGAAAIKMQNENAATTVTVTDTAFKKKRYEYRETVSRTGEVPTRVVITMPGTIESVVGGKKTASDTVEFDQTHAKLGDVFGATSTAFAFGLGSGGANAADVSSLGKAAWLMPVSVGSICVGVALLLTGWFRTRQAARSSGTPSIMAAPTFASRVPTPVRVEEVASVFCTQCGAPNAAGRKFCGRCGGALETS